MTVKIVTDSTSYLPRNLRRELDIDVISLNVHLGDESFREDEIDNHVFYQKMAACKQFPTTSQPAVQEFVTVFERHVQADEPVVAIFLSSKMSGTFSTASLARQMLLERYPQAEIEIIDSKSNSMEMGLAVLNAARAAKAGKTFAEVKAAAEHTIARSRFLFVPEKLDYLKKGGRLSSAAALIGSVLQIKPVLTVIDGAAEVFSKVRSAEKALDLILSTFLADVKEKGFGEAVVHHINNELEGYRLAARIEKELHVTPAIIPIGPIIGCHVGPGALGIAYYTKDASTLGASANASAIRTQAVAGTAH